MYSKYHVKADELTSKFLESIKTLLKGREIEIIIHDFDDTDYLLESEANKEKLLKSIENVNKSEKLKEVKMKDLH